MTHLGGFAPVEMTHLGGFAPVEMTDLRGFAPVEMTDHCYSETAKANAGAVLLSDER
jgi:hypothetical protein